ncbi:MAG: nucleotidyltransferase family protein [Acidobacteria bacterium]|nr:nucleotidyltransferase family protein [Acidobacteriota bacterium]
MNLPASLWPRLNQFAGNETWPPTEPPAVERFIAQARTERLIHLAHAANFPGKLGQMLASRSAETMVARAGVAMFHDVLRKLAEMVDPIPVIPIKGIAYGLYLYDEPILRPGADLDVLVPIEHYQATNSLLESKGYLRTYPFGITGHHPEYHESNIRFGNVLLEVHHSLIQRSRHTVPYEMIFERSVPLTDQPNVRRMSDIDTLLAHCLGFAKEHFQMTLSHWLDLWLLLHQPAIVAADPAEIIEEAESWSVLTGFLSSLRTLPSLFPESNDHTLVLAAQRLPARSIPPRQVLASRNRKSRLAQIYIKFRALDGWTRRCAFAVQFLRMQIETRLGLIEERGDEEPGGRVVT